MTRRSQLADALFALDGTPRALALTSPKLDEKQVCLTLLARCERQPGQTLILIGYKNLRGERFEAELAKFEAKIVRPRRKDERGPRAPPGADPPANRVDRLDRQGHPHPRASRRSHSSQPVRAHCDALPRTGCRRDPKPLSRPHQPLASLLHDLMIRGTTH
ncbi:MAG TPA: hypothetical protein VND98_09955 [Solirubrobacterales bacterium]|nr:hypothetical protein [Solirubrobacterales bacterium]